MVEDIGIMMQTVRLPFGKKYLNWRYPMNNWRKVLLILLVCLTVCFAMTGLVACDQFSALIGNKGENESSSEDESEGSEGLKYKLSDDQTYYILTGLGFCEDKEVVIPAIYNKLPVKEITGFEDGEEVDAEEVTSVTISKYVLKVEITAFDACEKLTDFIVHTDNTKYQAIDGNLYKKKEMELLVYPNGKTESSFVVPDGVEKIGDSVFANREELTSITLPQTLDKIGNKTFEGCKNLKGMQLPEGLSAIGAWAFSGCELFKELKLPDSLIAIEEGAFKDCRRFIRVVLPINLETLEKNVFQGCDKLMEIYNKSKVEISAQGVTDKGDYIGRVVPNIYTPTNGIGKLITDQSGYTFYTSGSLKLLIHYEGTATELQVPNWVNIITEFAFCDNEQLTSVVIPTSVIQIRSCAFQNCKNLKSVTFESAGGWSVKKPESGVGGSGIPRSELLQSSTAAWYLTNTYCEYLWIKS